tara:strand:+ start:1760 stop:2299 length:540 start_codon:yes stop_codon:yes gene_type:complete
MNYFVGDWNMDNAIMTEILDEIHFYSGTERKKMLKTTGDAGSMLFGVTWRSWLSPAKNREYDDETGKYKTKVYAENPHLKDVFKEFSQLYFPDFEWKQVQMNKNFPCPKHKDSKNVGFSYAIGFGEYEGGELVVVNENGTEIDVNINLAPFTFDGSKYIHYVKPFTGTRYSLIFYCNYK